MKIFLHLHLLEEAESGRAFEWCLQLVTSLNAHEEVPVFLLGFPEGSQFS